MGKERAREKVREKARGQAREMGKEKRKKAREKVGEKVEVKKKREKVRLVEQGEGKAQLHSRGSPSSSAGRARRKAFVQRSSSTCSGGLE